MESDRELLEWAAKAVGRAWDEEITLRLGEGPESLLNPAWRPLDDDGQALRLAVKLRIKFYEGAGEGPEAWAGYFARGNKLQKFACEPHEKDPYAATRRAIVRAAASIGRADPAVGGGE